MKLLDFSNIFQQRTSSYLLKLDYEIQEICVKSGQNILLHDALYLTAMNSRGL